MSIETSTKHRATFKCSISDCSNRTSKHGLRGMCRKHYACWRRSGQPEMILGYTVADSPIRNDWTDRPNCSVDGCLKIVKCMGLCEKHYSTNWCSIRREQIKKKAVELLGGKCARCGLQSEIYAIYEFHHRDLASKRPGTSMSTMTNWRRFWEEVQKCDMICANCHQTLTWLNRKDIGRLISERQQASELFKATRRKKTLPTRKTGRSWKTYHCLRCNSDFRSIKDRPVACRLCRNPRWEQETVSKGGLPPKWTVDNFLPLVLAGPTVKELMAATGTSAKNVLYFLNKLGLKSYVKAKYRKKRTRAEMDLAKAGQQSIPF